MLTLILFFILIIPVQIVQTRQIIKESSIEIPSEFRWNERKINLIFTCNVKNIGNETIDMEAYIAKPRNLENQEIIGDIFYDPEPNGFDMDRWGQEVAIFNYILLPDQKITLSYELNASIYTIRYFLFPWKIKGEIPKEILDKYTADDTLYKINDTYIQDIVKDVIGNTKNILFKAIKLHDYVINNLEYYNNWYWDDAVTTFKRGNGSCSDYCFAYIALCRAAGIPARYKGGTLLNSRMPYTDIFFHRIVEIYLPGYGWVPVDPTFNDFQHLFRHFFFGYISNNLFVLTVGGGSSEFLGWSYHYWYKNSSQDRNITTDCNMKWNNIL